MQTKKSNCPKHPEKTSYRSMHDAAVVSRAVEFYYNKRLKPYKCDWCDGYHLTSQTGEEENGTTE